jgi:hypothetical protein
MKLNKPCLNSLRYFITGSVNILLTDIYLPLTTKRNNMLLNLVSGKALTHHAGLVPVSALKPSLAVANLASASMVSALILAPTKSTGSVTGCLDMKKGTVQKSQNLLEDCVWPIGIGRLMGDRIFLLRTRLSPQYNPEPR